MFVVVVCDLCRLVVVGCGFVEVGLWGWDYGGVVVGLGLWRWAVLWVCFKRKKRRVQREREEQIEK